MLFLGSRKYPQEAAFKDYLQLRGTQALAPRPPIRPDGEGRDAAAARQVPNPPASCRPRWGSLPPTPPLSGLVSAAVLLSWQLKGRSHRRS